MTTTTFITVEPTGDTPFRYFVQSRDELGTVRYSTTYDDRSAAVAGAERCADKLESFGLTIFRSF